MSPPKIAIQEANKKEADGTREAHTHLLPGIPLGKQGILLLLLDSLVHANEKEMQNVRQSVDLLKEAVHTLSAKLTNK